jgi:hypothetical protein
MSININHAHRPSLICRWYCDAEGRLACVWELEFPPPPAGSGRRLLPRLPNLTPRRVPASVCDGGSRKGSKGNAVRAFGCHAAAAPATVGGEPATENATGDVNAPGKAVAGEDPRARRPATSRGHTRTHRAGCPGVASWPTALVLAGTVSSGPVRGDGWTCAASRILPIGTDQKLQSASARFDAAGPSRL